MFVLGKSQSYVWPVAVELPVSGGQFHKETFDAEFKRVSASRIKEIGELIKEERITDAELCKEILVGWKGVLDDQKQEMPFSETNRDELLDVPLVAAAVVTAWFNSLAGGKRKN